MNRRSFLASASLGVGAAVVGARLVGAQQGQSGAQVGIGDSSNLFAMDQAAARSVRRAPKPGATPLMTDLQRDELERQIRCQCGCTLDVYTCRTTDFSCRVSPAMHRDVMSLVAGGYSAQEIIDGFVGEYGERVLMAPRPRGFNLVGYIAPFLTLGAAAALLVLFLRRSSSRKRVPVLGPTGSAIGATGDELARLADRIRSDE